MKQIDITEQLQQWKDGDPRARDAIFTALYPVLKQRALGVLRLSYSGKLSFSATDLLHASYQRLVEQRGFSNRAHFLAIAATTLRRVLLDLLRERAADKRGSADRPICLHSLPGEYASADSPLEVAHLIQILERLEQADPRAAKVLELRLLGGLSVEEVAEVLQISVPTVVRDFSAARALLNAERSQ